MINICVYVPEDSLKKVSQAMFKAGAGKIGEYEKCAFYVKGTGQFLPLAGSDPHIGKKFELDYVQELRLEMTAREEIFDAVMQAMFDSHPYEEPVWNAFKSLTTKAKSKPKY